MFRVRSHAVGSANPVPVAVTAVRAPVVATVPGEATVGALVPAQPRPAPDVRRQEIQPASRRGLGNALLRFGVGPFLLALDTCAWAVAARIDGWDLSSLVLLPAIVLLYQFAGLYRSRLTLSALDDASHILGRALAAGAFALAVSVAVVGDGRGGWPLLTAIIVGLLVVTLRSLGYAVVRGVRARGLIAHNTLVLGAGRVGAQLAEQLLEHPEYGLMPIGFLDRDPLLAEHERPVPLLGGDEVLAETIVEFDVHDVVVAFGSLPESGLVEVIRTCDRLQTEIFFVPRLFELHTTTRDMDHVWGLPLVRLRRAAFRSPTWRVKRLVDFLVSAVALLGLAPVMAAVAVAVRIEGGPGILFRQERVGLDNRPFELLKFRSLRPADESESRTNWNIALDERLGPVGRFIRSTSLDELPQLWNILTGRMSLVGPRPERPHFVDTFSLSLPRYLARHRVPAGLTGWAQVHGLRGDTSIADRARFDNYYIENWSLWLDVRIVLMTVKSVLRRAGR